MRLLIHRPNALVGKAAGSASPDKLGFEPLPWNGDASLIASARPASYILHLHHLRHMPS